MYEETDPKEKSELEPSIKIGIEKMLREISEKCSDTKVFYDKDKTFADPAKEKGYLKKCLIDIEDLVIKFQQIMRILMEDVGYTEQDRENFKTIIRENKEAVYLGKITKVIKDQVIPFATRFKALEMSNTDDTIKDIEGKIIAAEIFIAGAEKEE